MFHPLTLQGLQLLSPAALRIEAAMNVADAQLPREEVSTS